jgi:hypothetical protein
MINLNNEKTISTFKSTRKTKALESYSIMDSLPEEGWSITQLASHILWNPYLLDYFIRWKPTMV